MRILVTGGSGLLGAEVVRQLLQVGTDEVLAGYNLHVPVAGIPTHIDLTVIEEISSEVRRIRPDLVIHSAAMTDVDLCEQRPELAEQVNGEATARIGQELEKLGSFAVYVSTDYVFDGKTGSYKEDSTPRPVNFYGESKLLGEAMLKETGVEHCTVRTSVVYGWGRRHRPNYGLWLVQQLKSKQQIKVVEGYFSSPTLNQNAASMIIEVARKRMQGTIHLAGATRIDRYSLALQIARVFNFDQKLVQATKADNINWVASRPRDSSLNVGKATRVLDVKPLNLEEALAQFKKGQEN